MWFWLALVSGILSAISVVLNKRVLKNIHPALLSWALFAFPIIPLIYLSFRQGMPQVNQLFFVGITGSGIFFVFAKTLSNESFKQSFLSKIYPLSAIGTIFTYILGLIFLSETITATMLAGLFLIVVGAYILNADLSNNDLLEPIKILFRERASLIYLLAMLLGSITAIFDKIGLKSVTPDNPALVMLGENIVMSIFLTYYLYVKDKHWLTDLREHFAELVLNSFLYAVLVLVVFISFKDAPVALVLGIKRLEIFFVLILSMLFFGDKPKKHVWIGTALMLAGVVLIKLA